MSGFFSLCLSGNPARTKKQTEEDDNKSDFDTERDENGGDFSEK